ncbi:allose kinase [Pseudomonas cerasi]
MTDTWLGIDIGGTSTRLMLMDNQQHWLNFHKIATASWSQSSEALTELAQRIAQFLEQQPVSGIMLGLPGILSRDRQQVLSLPFIQRLDNQPVAAELSERLGLPVAMDKDVNHLLLWDLLQLPQLPDSAVGLYLGTGMGNSLWLNRQFYHGEHGAAGELGHIPFGESNLPCPCGNQGCAETVTSGHWLSGWAAQHLPDIPLAEVFSVHRHHPVLEAFVTRLAKVIAMEMNILDPDTLILGGGVLAMADFPQDALRQQIRQYLRPPITRSGLNIVFSAPGDQTGCRGACLAAQRHFRRSNK